MADISIDEAKAKSWLRDVQDEIDAVDAILTKVQTSLQTIPGEDDSIMQGIYKLGTGMEETWTRMCHQFKEAGVGIGKAIDLFVDTGEDIVNSFKSILGRLGR